MAGEGNFIKRLDQLLLVMSTVRFPQRSHEFNRGEVRMGFVVDKIALKSVSLTSNAGFLCQSSSSMLCIYRRSRDRPQPQSAFRCQSRLIRPDLQPDRPCRCIGRSTCSSWILITLCMQVNAAHEFISHCARELNLHVGISKLITPYLMLLNTAITSNNTQFK